MSAVCRPIAVVGDYNPANETHLATGRALAHSAAALGLEVEPQCNFGLNPDYVESLRGGALQIVGADEAGTVRVVELAGHPFFIGTLFVPQTSSTPAAPHPLVSGFVRACAGV